MTFKKIVSILVLALLGSSTFAKDITVNKAVGKALDNLHHKMVVFKGTDQFNADFMTMYDGMKQDKWEYSEKVYNSAIKNAMEVARPDNMLRTINKGRSRQALAPKRTVLVSDLKKRVSFAAKGSCCGECTLISQSDFGEVGETLVIDEPGKYCFAEDITFRPDTPQMPEEIQIAIQINASDVTIDQCGHKLQQDPTAQDIFAVVGYEIVPGNKNITIKNGTICNYQGAAIRAFIEEAQDPANQLTLDSLCFSHLTITDNGNGVGQIRNSELFIDATGISLGSNVDNFPNPPEVFVYSNIVIDECKILRNTEQSVLVSSAQGLTIENTQINDTFVNEEPVFGAMGLSVFASRNIRLLQSTFNGSKVLDPFALISFVVGFSSVSSENIVARGCQFNDSFGEASLFVEGADAFLSRNVQFIDCQFNNPLGGAGDELVGIGALLIFSYGEFINPDFDTGGSQFIRCQFNGATRLGETPAIVPFENFVCGTFINGTKNIIFEDCQSSRIATQNKTFQSTGFFIRRTSLGATQEFPLPRNTVFRNCVASDIKAFRFADGFLVRSESLSEDGFVGTVDNTSFENCIAENIESFSDDALATGISCRLSRENLDFFPLSTFRNAFVQGCTVANVRGGSNDSAGIYFESVKNPIICDTSIVDCPNGILFTGIEGIVPANLFQLAETKPDAEAEPPVVIDLLSIPMDESIQTFENVSQGNSVDIDASQQDFAEDLNLIAATDNLNDLGWERGDTLKYLTNGTEAIEPLEDGEEYFLVVYTPEFTDCGLVQGNKITNCSLAGIRDDRCPTGSAFICNTAFKNGTPASHKANYDIKWEKCPPVCEGTLAEYPECKKPFNVSLIPCKDKCRNGKRNHNGGSRD